MFDACLLIQNEVISYDPSMDAGITVCVSLVIRTIKSHSSEYSNNYVFGVSNVTKRSACIPITSCLTRKSSHLSLHYTHCQ